MTAFETVLITGATGFVGAHLVRHFANKPLHVIATGRTATPPQALLDTADEYFKADIITDELPKQADIIIHVAGLASDTAKWKDLKNANITGTKRLFQQVKYQLFIYISSSSVYPKGNFPHEEAEMIDIENLHNYGKSKCLAEVFLQTQQNVCILRPRAIYGTHDRVLLPKILGMKKGAFVIAPCHLRYKASLTHIDNLMHAIDLSISQPQKSINQNLNVTDTDSYILRDIIESIYKAANGTTIPIKSLPFPLIKNISKVLSKLGVKSKINDTALDMICQHNVLNSSKIKNILGYQPSLIFEQSVPALKEWLQQKNLKKFIESLENSPWR